ncbi:Protocadherin-9, partial [Fasciola gigantica]
FIIFDLFITDRFFVFLSQILDENDNAPIFERSNYQVRLRENQASVSLLSVKVHDADSDSNGRLSYTMQPSRLDLTTTTGFSVSADFLRTHIQLIPVNDGVTLRVSQPLDYEKQKEFTFDLIASDHGQPALSATAQVHVTVINVNDFAPLIRFYYHGEPLDRDYSRLSVLEQHESVSEVENKLICHVHVTDADSEFESINCTVESTERSFFLREVSTNRLIQRSKIYELLTTTRLDREVHERLLILVRCRDGEMANSLVSQNQLQLILLDVNDHSPVFTQEHYHGSVSENLANAMISFTSQAGKTPTHGVQATDMDIGMNALVFYSLVPWVINDTDDNHTAWEGETENVIINATYTDIQPDRTQFGRTTNTSTRMHSHNLREDVDKFYIDQATGQIRTRIALDCEGQQVYRFLVLAIDQSEQLESRHTATARVTIRVSDENDNPPVIRQRHYAFSVKEGLPRHTRIGQIQSVDADVNSENRRTIYELKNVENCNASEFILVESHTGYLRTRQVLDCEATKQISFIVLARNEQPVQELFRGKQTINTDKGPTFFDEVSVIVTVEDENDNAPALVQRGPSTNDRVIGGRELTPSVIDLTFKTDQNETNNPCIEFPYVIVDRDEGANGQTEVLLENNAFFEFRLDNTILCKKRVEQPTVNQMNLFITVQDKPVDKTKTLRRQYTIRIHFVKDKIPIDGSRQLEQFQVSRFSSNPTVFSGIEQTETKPGRTKHSKIGRKSKIRDSGTKLNRVDNNEFHSEKPLNSSATIIIVAILVVVSGLLCLLLLGVVFALRKATPTRNNTSSDVPGKPCEEEAGDNSGLLGQRAQMQHIYILLQDTRRPVIRHLIQLKSFQ